MPFHTNEEAAINQTNAHKPAIHGSCTSVQQGLAQSPNKSASTQLDSEARVDNPSVNHAEGTSKASVNTQAGN